MSTCYHAACYTHKQSQSGNKDGLEELITTSRDRYKQIYLRRKNVARILSQENITLSPLGKDSHKRLFYIDEEEKKKKIFSKGFVKYCRRQTEKLHIFEN
mmetsp:Transcript_954/g.861  ORF Transcript_954/g.861 Transcript_954/m.861 type:complete len:100 (+) Transcript_954:341-640(+)